MPLSNWTRLQGLFTSAGTKLYFRDPQLNILAEKDEAELSGKPEQEVERSGIPRVDLRDALLDGLNAIVQWGKVFQNYDTLPDGTVRVFFEDGTTVDGDLLVGADGPNSAVRHQVLPTIQRLDLGVTAIAGRYILDEENTKRLTPEITNGSLNNIVPTGKGWMFTSAWRSRPVEHAANGVEETAGRVAEHYVVWAYVIPSNDAPDGKDRTDASVLHQLVAKGIKSWSPELQELIQGADPSATKCFPLKSMPILESWKSSNITLIGDAIHNMTPMAGKGANTALRDAEVLTKHLVDAAAARVTLLESVRLYEEEMRGYANEALGLSTQNALNASNGGSIQRLFFRGFLFVVEAFPSVKRATLGKTAK